MTIIDDRRERPCLTSTCARHRDAARVIAIEGDLTAASEDVLMDAYARANEHGVRVVVLDFTGLDYMNSGGIGLLVTLLVRAQRAGQQVLAFGLSDHYRQIFELTRLDEAIGIHDDEGGALAASGMSDPAGRQTRRRRRPPRDVADPGLREDVAEDVLGRACPAALATPGAGDRHLARVASATSGRPATASTAPLTGLAPGEVARIDMDMPGRVTLSTGVLVLYADDESFTLMTPQGHMFAGWITFSAARRGRGHAGQGAGADARERPALRDRPDARRPPPGGPLLGGRR